MAGPVANYGRTTLGAGMMRGVFMKFSGQSASKQRLCNMIKAGTLCRTLVWPILPPLILYKWIRDTDRDMYAVEILRHRSTLDEHPNKFYNASAPGDAKHWRMQHDLELIYNAVNTE